MKALTIFLIIIALFSTTFAEKRSSLAETFDMTEEEQEMAMHIGVSAAVTAGTFFLINNFIFKDVEEMKKWKLITASLVGLGVGYTMQIEDQEKNGFFNNETFLYDVLGSFLATGIVITVEF